MSSLKSALLIPCLFLSLALLAQAPKGFKTTPSGLRYIVYKTGKDTAKPQLNDWIALEMRYSANINGKDSLLFDSRAQMKGIPVRFQLPKSDFQGDLYEGLCMLSPGDSGIFLINADSLFIRTFKMAKRPAVIPDKSTITFNVILMTAESSAEMKKREDAALNKCLDENMKGVLPTQHGIYVRMEREGEGLKIDTGCMVTLNFSVALASGNQVFSSFDGKEPVKFEYGKKFDTKGIDEAIGQMKKGCKATVVVPTDMAFGEKGWNTIVPPFASLIYQVEIIDVAPKAAGANDPPAIDPNSAQSTESLKNHEPMLLEAYLKTNNITTQPTPSGLYYIETSKGTGPRPTTGQKVKVHYTGRLIDGKKFDSSVDRGEPLELTLGVGMVIKGWDEGIAMMNQGGKATLIIPSKLGYGERAMGSAIPAYSTLVFDVELVEVK